MRREIGERVVDPALEGVAAEVLLHDHVRISAHIEPGEPRLEELVQRGLADADRRVGPDRAERQVSGDLVGRHRADVVEPEFFGVTADQVEGALVHVERPDARVG